MAFASLHDSDRLARRQASLFARAVEIVVGDALAGILRFEGWGMKCDATCADGMWTFRRHGFLWRNVTVEQTGTGQEIAEVKMRFASGTLVMQARPEAYAWKQLGFWSGETAFMSGSEFPIVRFKPKRFSFKDTGEVAVQREYRDNPDLPFLIMLGVYLSVLNQRRRRS
jgi:hypothetical protein